jgi:hypothetical protein
MDLMVVDIPEIPFQCLHSFYFYYGMEQFEAKFYGQCLHDHKVVTLFHTDGVKIKMEIKGFLKVHHFKVFKE